jgi:glycosyltransferase involved in cell wall biosynthesis
VEQYIVRCLTSLIQQTYLNIQVVIVDDGSTDESPLICDEWTAKDSRFITIHKKNQGVAAARLSGVKAAKGEYILFVDADDWIAPSTVEESILLANSSSADLVIYDHMETDGGKRTSYEPHRRFPSAVGTSAEYALCCLFEGKYTWNCWQLFINRNLFSSKIDFLPGVQMGEDLGFTCQLLCQARTISFLPRSLYYYYQRPNSTTHAKIKLARQMRDVNSVETKLMEPLIHDLFPQLQGIWAESAIRLFYPYFLDTTLYAGDNADCINARKLLEKTAFRYSKYVHNPSIKELLRIGLINMKLLHFKAIAKICMKVMDTRTTNYSMRK